MAYDKSVGLQRSSCSVIPRISDSEDNEQFSVGNNSSHSASYGSMETGASNSVAQMIEKRRNQSHCALTGIWKSEKNDSDINNKDEEIQNDFSNCAEESDLGFDNEIMNSHSMVWETDINGESFKSTFHTNDLELKGGEFLPHTPNNAKSQENCVPYSKPGNASHNEVTDEIHPITEVHTKISVGYNDNHEFGCSLQTRVESKTSSVCESLKEGDVFPNIDGNVNGCESLLDVHKKANETGKEMDLNNVKQLNSGILQNNNGTSVHYSTETEIDGGSFGVQFSGTMRNENAEETVNDVTSKTSANIAHQTSSENGTPSNSDIKSRHKDAEDNQRQQISIQSSNINRIDSSDRSTDEDWDFPDNKTNRNYYTKNYRKPFSKTPGYQSWNNNWHWNNYYDSSSYCVSYMKHQMRALEEFAADNDLELHDVLGDGNCMFRALEDQMQINAQFGHTARSLRRRAVEYLRQNPIQEDGSHLKEFLAGKETWEAYLYRMERNSSWGDHLILKALCDTVGRTIVVFNISNDDIRRTELVPKVHDKSIETQFFLGHLGEYHYVSLRPKIWERTWPLHAHIYREKWTHHRILSTYIEARLNKVELIKKIANYENMIRQNRKMMSILSLEDEADDTRTAPSRALPALCLPHRYNDAESSEEATEERELHDQLSRVQKLIDEVPKCYKFRGWCENDSEESRYLLTADPLYTDPGCGIPSPHLSFILRFCLQKHIQLPVNMYYPNTSKAIDDNFVVEYAGSSCDESNAYIVDQRENCAANAFTNSNTPMKIFCRKSIVVKFETNENKKEDEVFVDESQTHAGYCRLRPSVASEELWENQILRVENDCFIKEDVIKEDISSDSSEWPDYHGFQSHEWVPSKTDWKTRERPSQWPSEELMEKIYKAGVLFVRRPHASSQLKLVEWEMIFSRAEKEIFQNTLSANQKNSYNVFKVLVDYQTKFCSVKLSPEHLKAVFLRAMERVPLSHWENNIGGCFLYLLNLLSDFLGKGGIPHYFISENNTIDHVPAESIQDLKYQVDAIKYFPIEVLEFCFERHGILESEIPRIIADIDGYTTHRNIYLTVDRVFIAILKTRAEYYGDYYQFQKAHDAVLDAYLVYQQMIQVTNMTANVLTMEEFVLEALCNWPDVNRYKMLRMFDNLHNTTLCDKEITNETVLVKTLLEEEIESEFSDMPIPQNTLGNTGFEAKLLEEIATTCNFLKKDGESLVFIKAAISLFKKALQEDNIDVAEVEDANLKREIARKRLQLVTTWNAQLGVCYEKLSTCCTASHQQELMFQYMPEIEALAQRSPKMVPFVEKMWIQLGQTLKGKEFRKKHEGFQKNVWSQNDYSDVD